jgi:hypothetical protein
MVLAKAINSVQARQVRQTRQYQPLSRLGDLPPVPAGFELTLYADASGYIFSVKDRLDPAGSLCSPTRWDGCMRNQGWMHPWSLSNSAGQRTQSMLGPTASQHQAQQEHEELKEL